MFNHIIDYEKFKTKNWSKKDMDFIKNARKENFGIYFDITGTYYIGLRSFIKIFLCGLVIIPTSIFLFMTVIICYTDFVLLCETIHFLILTLTSTVVAVTVLYFRDTIDYSMAKIGKQFHDYEETLDQETLDEISNIRRGGNKTKHFFQTSFLSIFSIAIFFMITRPLLEELTGLGIQNDFDILNFPIRIWVPIAWRNDIFIYSMGIGQTYAILFVFLLWMGLDSYQIGTLQEIITNLDVCAVTLTNFEQRAFYIFEKKYGRKPNLKSDKDIRLISSIINGCIKSSVDHHLIIAEFFDKAYTFGYYPYLLILLTITVLLFLAILLITAKDVPLQAKSTFALLGAVYCLHYFIFCHFGELITQKSGEIGAAVYRGKWYNWVKETKVYTTMIQNKGLTPMSLSSGGFTSLSHESFSNMINTAFSYYNILKAGRD